MNSFALQSGTTSIEGTQPVKSMFFARAETRKSAEPVLELDIVPTGKPNEFRVAIRGKPVAREKVMVYAPNLWMIERTTDDAGLVAIETPWTGRCVIDVVHVEKTPGSYQGVAYESVRCRATCAIVR